MNMNTMYPMNPLNNGTSMFNPYYNMQNPVIPNYPVVQQQNSASIRKVECVNGKESAMTFPLGPNSSVILVDNLSPRVFLVTTDASGYKAIQAFKITPDDEEAKEQPIQAEGSVIRDDNEVAALKDRLDQLEERLKKYEQQSDESHAESTYTGKSGNGNAQPNDWNGKGGKGSYGKA